MDPVRTQQGPRSHTSYIANNEYLNNTNLSCHKTGTNNPYSGALNLPRINLLIQSQGLNCRPGADHHYLAKESESPAVMYGNSSQAVAVKVLEYQADNPHVRRVLPPKCKKRDVVVFAPEDPTVSRKFRVGILMIPLTKLTSDVQEQRGHAVVSSAEITRSIMFKQDYIKNVDVILILGVYCLEPRSCAHKVLLLCFPVLKVSISRADATTMLSYCLFGVN